MAGEWVIGNMLAKLGADTKDYIKDMTGAQEKAKEFAKDVKKSGEDSKASMSKVSSGAKDIVGSLLPFATAAGAITFGLAQAKDAMDQFIKKGESVKDVSRALGITAEEASTLIEVADDLFISVDQLQQGFKFAENQGIRPNIEGLKQLQQEYQAIVDPVERAQFAIDKFGNRAGPELAKLLELSGEEFDKMAKSAEAAGLIMGEKDVEDALALKGSLDELNDSITGVKLSFAGLAGPTMTAFLKQSASSISVLHLLQKAYQEGRINLLQYGLAFAEASRFQMDLEEAIRLTTPQVEGYQRATSLANDEVLRSSGILDDYAGRLANSDQSVMKLAMSTQEVAKRNREARSTTRDWLSELDTGLSNTIANWLNEIKFLAQGGGEVQKAAEKVHEAVLSGAITPAEAQAYFNELIVSAELVKVKMGEITGEQAAQNIATTLNVKLADAKKLIEDIKREGQFNLTSSITVEIFYKNYVKEIAGLSKLNNPKFREKNKDSGGSYNAGDVIYSGVPEFFIPAQSGTAVPASHVRTGGVTYYDNSTVVNNDRRTAALSLAMLHYSQQQRLNASMGG